MPNAIFQWDANASNSYPGSGQVINNMIATPYGGDSQAALNWQLGFSSGVAADDMVYTPGVPSSFVTDGNEMVSLGANTTFLTNLHRSDTPDVFACIFTFTLGAVGVSQNVIGNSNGSTISGWRVDVNSANTLRFIRSDGTVNGKSQTMFSGLEIGVPYLAVLCYNPATGAWKSGVNSRTFNDGSTDPFPNTVTGTGRFCHGAANNSGTKMAAGGNVNAMALAATDLNDTQLSSIVSYYNAAHSRIYTP